MSFTPPTHMETPCPYSHAERYYICRIVTPEQIELHWHNFFEIDFIDEGKGTHLLNGVQRSFGRGTLSILGTFDFHGYYYNSTQDEHISGYSFHFDDHIPDQATLHRLRMLAGKQLQCDDRLYQLLLHEFQLLEEECNASRPESDDMVKNLLERITLYASQLLGEGGEDIIQGDIPTEMIYIENNFRRAITLKDAAKATGFSEDYFSKLFKRRYGVLFQDYLLTRRLQWAYGLLCASNLPVITIAYEAGFNSQAYFCRVFKKRYGLSHLQARARSTSRPTS